MSVIHRKSQTLVKKTLADISKQISGLGGRQDGQQTGLGVCPWVFSTYWKRWKSLSFTGITAVPIGPIITDAEHAHRHPLLRRDDRLQGHPLPHTHTWGWERKQAQMGEAIWAESPSRAPMSLATSPRAALG